ncbi:MAG: trypsin-like peptidase domain-containing protein [Planctomycetota bacterium]|nr:trypsin-like peptidase domain-containing protein [Planctomycetota bacterium]
MKRFALLVPLALLSMWLVGDRALAEDPPAPDPAVVEAEKEYQEALEKALSIEKSLLKTVRKVRTYSVSVLNKQVPRGQPEAEPRLVGVGSGVIVSYKGKLWIITNVHVIQGAAALDVVTHDGKTHVVDTHDTIPQYDIALLKFRERVRGYKGVTMSKTASTSPSKIREGTWVIATGNPFFLALDGRSVTTLGVVSGLERFLGGQFQYVDAIQHDTEVNPGNSGGPLWNLKGDLVGINGKIATSNSGGAGPSNTGASFSLPVHQVMEYMRFLTKAGDARSGYLGIDVDSHRDAKGKPAGAKITRVRGNSPTGAASAKKRPMPGDIIWKIQVDGSTRRIYDATDLRSVLSIALAGDKFSLYWKRGKKSMSFKGKLAGR